MVVSTLMTFSLTLLKFLGKALPRLDKTLQRELMTLLSKHLEIVKQLPSDKNPAWIPYVEAIKETHHLLKLSYETPTSEAR